MIGRWTRFVAWLWAPEGGLPLALFRILVAVAVLVNVLSVVNHDLVDLVWVSKEYGGYRHLSGSWLVKYLGGPTPRVVWSLVWSTLGLGVLMLLGLGGRLTAFLTLQLFMGLADINGHAGGSYDELTKNALWLCVLAPTTANLSADAWIFRGHPLAGRPVPAWGRALIAFQIVLVYWTTGLQKVSAFWVPGGDLSALYYILQQPSWQRYDLSFFAWLYPLTQAATFFTWLWEVTAPLWLVGLWMMGRERWRQVWRTVGRWLRTGYAAIGLFFHAALLVTLEVGPFPLISLAFYPAFFSEDELVRLWRGAVGRFQRSGEAAAPGVEQA